GLVPREAVGKHRAVGQAMIAITVVAVEGLEVVLTVAVAVVEGLEVVVMEDLEVMLKVKVAAAKGLEPAVVERLERVVRDVLVTMSSHLEGPSLNPAVANKEERDRPKSGGNVYNKFGNGVLLSLRPGFGKFLQSEGKFKSEIHLRTNHFALTLDDQKEIYRYHVNVADPEIPPGRKRRQFFLNLLQDIPELQSMQHRIATDYSTTLITAGKIEFGNLVEELSQAKPDDDKSNEEGLRKDKSNEEPSNVEKSGESKSGESKSGEKHFRLKYHEEGALPRPTEKPSWVTISLVGVVPTSEMARYLQSVPEDSTHLESRLSTVQALNIVVNATPNENAAIYQASRNVFAEYPRNSNPMKMTVYQNVNLTGGLIGVRAYYSSTKTSTARILLNVHGQCSPFYPELNLRELIQLVDPSGLDGRATEWFLRRLRVRFNYIKKDGQNIKTVGGFRFQGDRVVSSQSVRFESSEYAQKISVADYFKKKHGITLAFPGAPVTNFGSDEKPAWIPVELGTVMPGQPYRGKLNNTQTKIMLQMAARGPAENARRLVNAGLKVIGVGTSNPILSAFGISINTKMIVVAARVLPPPLLLYYNQVPFKPEKASWNLAGRKFYKPEPLQKWSYLRCGQSTFSNNYLRVLRQQISACGLGDKGPEPPQGYHAMLGKEDDDKTDEALRKALQRAKDNGVKFLFVILEKRSKPIHARLKFFADIVVGIQHMTLVHAKLAAQFGDRDNAGVDYFANIMQKVNMKMGGINHILGPEGMSQQIQPETTMFVGIDVSHPTYTTMAKAPSIVGIVASLDDNFTKWYGSTRIQEGRVEMVAKIGELMGERLNLYCQKFDKYPANIIIYRDGVSEGQFEMVLEQEVSAIDAKCAQMYPRKNQKPPDLLVIICGKRHRTRFYPTNAEHADQTRNQNTRSGVKPCHCTVIRADKNFPPDVIQRLTHNLSYLYGRATKAVSLCTPGGGPKVLNSRRMNRPGKLAYIRS
ncbi:MAG: hypothetical protein Q9210_005343, partial [Variospora velana]